MTRTTEVSEFMAEFMAVPSSREQPGKPEETLPVDITNAAIFTKLTVSPVVPYHVIV